MVEVLVALVASALLLTVVMNGALLARERSSLAGDRRDAVLLARTLVAEAAAAPLRVGARDGFDGRLHWRLEERVLARDPRGRWLLAGIEVVVARGERRLTAVETRRLKAADS